MNKMNILITGGGTGGHLSPGVAIYEEAKEGGHNCIFLAGKADARFSHFKNFPQGDVIFYGAPSFSKNIFKLPLFAVKFLWAIVKARRVMKKNNSDVVIGMGGYVSGPALLAARMKGIPIVLCEQNSVPGKVTRMFEGKAARIYGTFEHSQSYLKNKEAFILAGNPIRKDVLKSESKEEARRAFHLEHCKKVILIIGGSQGALTLNRLIFGLKKEYAADLKDVGIIWSTGDHSYEEFRERTQNEFDGGSIYLSPYIDRVGLAYRASDIAISRSGAGVMAELAATGIPSVLVPYPFAADDHQDKNADDFVEAGAAIKVNNSEATPEKVAPLILDLLKSSHSLGRMSERALKVAAPEAAKTIIEDLQRVL